MSNQRAQLAIPFPRYANGAKTLEERRATGAHLWWHDSIIDTMIAHPEWTKQEIARNMGVSYSTIYLVTSSDLFLARFAHRRAQYSEVHDSAIGNRLASVALRALDLQLEIMNKKGDSIPLGQLSDISSDVLDKLGYGVKAKAGAGSSINVNVGAQNAVVSVGSDDLIAARQALRQAEGMRRAGTEGAATDADRGMIDVPHNERVALGSTKEVKGLLLDLEVIQEKEGHSRHASLDDL